jgi:hypothetical protein
MRCPVCQAANPPGSQRCQSCGAELQTPVAPDTVGNEALTLPAAPADDEDPHGGQDKEVDLVQVFIPYKNPKSLAAYYISFFALIPGIGFVLGPVAIWLGISGVRYASANPQAKGMVHAITGIVLGVVAVLCWNPFWCVLLIVAYFFLP